MIISSVSEMQSLSQTWRTSKKKIALVTTLGALHEGHLSLMAEAKKRADIAVASIFVNPTQFGPAEDYKKYPRDVKGDAEKAYKAGIDVIFAPNAADIYPKDYQTYVDVVKITQGLCAKTRPTHFRGVATVVLKLFNITQPDMAIFGEKDYQQLLTVRRMVEDLNLPIEIIGMPIYREKDGLAMSSRNAYLSQAERANALSIHRALLFAQDMGRKGENDAKNIVRAVKDMLNNGGIAKIDYVEICDSNTLSELDQIAGATRLLVAVYSGNTRLIDNCTL